MATIDNTWDEWSRTVRHNLPTVRRSCCQLSALGWLVA
jgi:hypothetical protein